MDSFVQLIKLGYDQQTAAQSAGTINHTVHVTCGNLLIHNDLAGALFLASFDILLTLDAEVCVIARMFLV